MSAELDDAEGMILPPDPDGVGPGFVLHAPSTDEVERVWRTYWKPMLLARGGGLQALKGELYDAWFLVNQARLVYRAVTGGLSDDLTASAEGILAMHDRRMQQLVQERDAAQQRVSYLEHQLARYTTP